MFTSTVTCLETLSSGSYLFVGKEPWSKRVWPDPEKLVVQLLVDIFFFLSLLTFLAMAIGVFKPSLVLPRSRSGAKPTPTRAVTVYLVATPHPECSVIVMPERQKH